MSLELPRGYAIEEFRIAAPLGVGGFGLTYLAYDTKLERRVAIKEYMPASLVESRDPATFHPKFRGPAESADYRGFLERFRDEALHIARFNHPNIVPIHRVLAHNESAYIVMEYLGEVSLARLAASGKRLAEAELAHLVAGVLDGLSTMHHAGLLHRDVKPSNIMLRGDGTPVLIDFGSVRRAHYEGEPASVRVISEGFSPPEQYDEDGEIGPWSDIFALAATSYFMIRGAPPAPVVDRVLALMRKKPDPLVALTQETTGGRYSDPFLAAISWGLELQERARPQSIPEWAALFPAPIGRRHYPMARVAMQPAPAVEPSITAAATPLETAPLGAAAHSAGSDSPATLIADARARPVPVVRALVGRSRQAAAIVPAQPRETRMRLLGQLTALGLILVGATVGVGVATQDIGKPLQIAENSQPAEEAAATKLTALAAPPAAATPSASAIRCDELAAHPDDPAKPRGLAGVQFDAMTEATTREAIESCTAALRLDPENLRAQFNLGRAYQRLARLRPQDSAEAWRRAGAAYEAAANGGYAAAQGNLGQMLYGGAGGGAQDVRQAVEWLRKSAAGDFADAYITLAHAYATGRGVERADQKKTFCWLTLLERTTSVPAYKAFAQQQRAAMAMSAADKRAVEDGASKGKDCL